MLPINKPREKLLTHGPSALTDTELLAILLNTGHGHRDTPALSLAKNLLHHCKGIRGLFDNSFKTMQKIPGIGTAKYSRIQATKALYHRYLYTGLKTGIPLTSSTTVKEFLTAKLRHYQQEVFACLFLDSHHRLIHFEKLFYGTINQSCVHPREIVKIALNHNAAAVIAAHNHPSGVSTPSPADITLTKILKQALALIAIDLLDHLVIGDTKICSIMGIMSHT